MIMDYLLNAQEEERLLKIAKEYDENEFTLFSAELGWEDWMDKFTEVGDGEGPSEKEIDDIDDTLRDIFRRAHS